MKLQKLANDLKIPVDQVIAAAFGVGITDAVAGTDVSNEKKGLIEKYLAEGAAAAESAEQSADSGQEVLAIVNELIVEETRSRMLREQLRPQVKEMISAALIDYERYKTVPNNPTLKQAVELLGKAGKGITAPSIEISAIELPEIDLLGWGNDPKGSIASLLPGHELPMLEAG